MIHEDHPQETNTHTAVPISMLESRTSAGHTANEQTAKDHDWKGEEGLEGDQYAF